MPNIDLYTTRSLIASIEGLNPASAFLRDRYFPTGPTNVFNSERVIVEYRDGDRRLAPFVTPLKNGVGVERIGSSMREYMPPTVAPMRPITLDDITKRGFGEALFGDLSPQQRAAVLATQDLSDLDRMITRREEAMAAETMLDNGCVMHEIGDDADVARDNEIRFYSEAQNPASYSVTTKWDASGAKILADLAEMVKMLTMNGLPARDFVCAPDVADAIVNDEAIQKLLDNRRYYLGEVAPALASDSASVMCVLNVRGHAINVISYDDTYVDGEGETQTYIPSGCGVMTAPGAGVTLYGAVSQVEQYDGQFHTYPGRRVPKYLSDATGNSRTLTLTARPVLCPRDKNPWVSAKNLLTA